MVCAIALGENDQTAPIEIDTAIMKVIGILLLINTTRAKPNLPRFVIDALDAAYHPLPFRDLVFHLAGVGVIEIEMVPTVALRHPDDFVRRIEIVGEEFAAVVVERLASLVEDSAGGAGLGIDGDDAQHLMAALIVQERETPRIGRPAHVLYAPRIGEQLILDWNFLARGHIEQMRLGEGDTVAGLEVIERVQLGLELVARRRLDEMDLVFLAFLRPQSHEFLAVGRPEHTPRIGIVRLAVLTQRQLFAAFTLAQIQVVILDENGPFAVGRVGATRAARPSSRRCIWLFLRGRRLGSRGFVFRERVGFQIAAPAFVFYTEAKNRAVFDKIKFLHRQVRGALLFVRGLRQRRGQTNIIEGGPAFALDRIHEDVFSRSVAQIVAIPEAIVIREPVRINAILEHLILRGRAEVPRTFVIWTRPLPLRRQHRDAEPESDNSSEQMTGWHGDVSRSRR